MTDEDKELLARIGQLAGEDDAHILRRLQLLTPSGQINRRKNEQAGAIPAAGYQHRHRSTRTTPRTIDSGDVADSLVANAYRRPAPYQVRGQRALRPRTHQNRTLHLNASSSRVDGGNADGSRWVAKNDRHLQLINANVYEKEVQNRAKAIEQTRKQKQDDKRRKEKARFNAFLTRQQGAAPTNSNTDASRDQIVVEGIQFRVTDGGKKLVKVTGTLDYPCKLFYGIAYTLQTDQILSRLPPKSRFSLASGSIAQKAAT
jgi:hypothetical protein